MNRRILSRLLSAGLIGLVLLAPDTGDGAGGGGDTSGSTDTGTGTGAGGDTGTAAGDAASTDQTDPTAGQVTMSQAELDKLISSKVGKAKATSEAEFRKWLEQQSLSETEKAQAEKAAAEQRAVDAENSALSARVETRAERLAMQAGVKPDRVDRFLRLVDLSELDELTADGKPDDTAIKAAVDKALADVPEFKGQTGATGGDNAGSGGADFTGAGDQTKKWTRDEIAKMSADEYAKHRDEIQAQLTAGAIS